MCRDFSFVVIIFRDELKTMLKNCLYHFHTIEIENRKSLDSDKLQCLLNTLRNDSSIILALKLEKERLCIDNYQKELLSLAILCDQSTTSETKSKHVSHNYSVITCTTVNPNFNCRYNYR